MCGIAGFWEFEAAGGEADMAAVASSMCDQLKHRGPDDNGIWLDAALGVGFASRAQERIPEYLWRRTVEQNLANIFICRDFARKTDGLERPRRMNEDDAFAGEILDFPCEQIRNSAPCCRVRKIGLVVLVPH